MFGVTVRGIIADFSSRGLVNEEDSRREFPSCVENASAPASDHSLSISCNIREAR